MTIFPACKRRILKQENEQYHSEFNNKIKEHSKLQLKELSEFFNPKFKTCCSKWKRYKKKNSVYSLLKGNYFATKAAHTVVLRANQRGVKMLRKKMAKAAQNSTPPQVVKSYCWYIGWKKVSLNSHILTLIDLAMNQNSLFLKLKDPLTVPH